MPPERIAGPATWNVPGALRSAPIVYAWLRGDVVQYVGLSRLGIGRVFTNGHHVLHRAAPDDPILVWTLPTAAEAEALEMRLIRQFTPPFNNARSFSGTPRPRKAPLAP